MPLLRREPEELELLEDEDNEDEERLELELLEDLLLRFELLEDLLLRFELLEDLLLRLRCRLAELLELKLEPEELEKDVLESEDELRECESFRCGLLNGFLATGSFFGICSTLLTVSLAWTAATGFSDFITVCLDTAIGGAACLVSGGCTVVFTAGGTAAIVGGSSLA